MLLLCALVAGSGSVWAQRTFKLITSTDELVAGCNYLIVTEEFSNASDPKVEASYYSIGKTNSATNRKAPEVTVSSNTITTTIGANLDDTKPRMFNLRTSAISGRWNFYNDAESGYLNGGYYNGSKNQNQIKIEDELSTNTGTDGPDGNFSITIDGEGNATITNQTDFSIWFNPNFGGSKGKKTFTNPLMSTYPSGSTQYTGVSLYREVVSATISSVGWTTFVSTSPLEFKNYSDANAYMVTNASGTTLTLSQVTGNVPAETPLLISGTKDATVNIPVAASSTTDVSANKLKKGTDASVNAADKYVLVARDSKAVFAPTGDHAATVPVGKAYLDLNGVTLAPEFVLDDSETTGIESVNSEVKGFFDGEFYNLSGQRVTKPTKGLYIVNGKKVIIK